MRGAGTRRRGSGPLSASSTPSARLRGRGHSEVCEGIGGQRRLKKAKTKNVNLCFFLATSLLALPSEATECVCDAGNKKEPLKKTKKALLQQKKGQPANPSLPRSRFSSSQPWPSQSMASRHRTRSQRPSLAPVSVPSPCRLSPTLP